MNIELIARRVAEEISDKHGVSVQFAAENLIENRDGSVRFTQGVEENFGIFKMIITKSAISVQVQKNQPQEGVPYHYWVLVGLEYEHPRGGTNGYTIGEMWLDKNFDIVDSKI